MTIETTLHVLGTNLRQVKTCPKQHQLADWIRINTKTTSKPQHHYMCVVAHDHKTCIKTAPCSRRIKATKIQGNGNLTADHDKLSVSYQHWAIKMGAYQFLSLPNCVTPTKPSQTHCKTTIPCADQATTWDFNLAADTTNIGSQPCSLASNKPTVCSRSSQQIMQVM